MRPTGPCWSVDPQLRQPERFPQARCPNPSPLVKFEIRTAAREEVPPSENMMAKSLKLSPNLRNRLLSIKSEASQQAATKAYLAQEGSVFSECSG